jgi:hypothetical protein
MVKPPSDRPPTSWRPPRGIRAAAIGTVRRNDAIFVFEGRDPTEDPDGLLDLLDSVR